MPSGVCGEQGCLVAGNRALRGERVHRLGARDPRHCIEREAGHVPLGERARELGRGERLEEPDDDGALGEQGDLGVGRLLHLADDLGPERFGCAWDDRGAGLCVGLVRERRAHAGSGLDDDLDAGFHQSADAVRDERDAALALGRLLRNA